MEPEDGGSKRRRGQECAAHLERLGTPGQGHLFADVTAEEQAAIRQFLKQPEAPGAEAGRAAALARAALKFAAVLLLAAGVVAGYADGNEFDEVGCSVAQRPGGTFRGAHPVESREHGGAKLPGAAGGSAGGAGDGGAAGEPECEVRAERCANRMSDGECRLMRRRCRLLGMQSGPSRPGQERGEQELMAGGLAGEAVAGAATNPAGALDCKSALAAILHRISAVAEGLHGLQQENGQLRNAKARLEQIVAEGLLKFLGRVDAQSLRVAYAVLAKGDLAKAARELKVKDSTLRDLVGKWKGMGKDHAVLAELVRWRKDTKFKGTVPLNEAVLVAEANAVDYRGLIEDVLDGLLMMTEGNWEDKREELAELLRPVAG